MSPPQVVPRWIVRPFPMSPIVVAGSPLVEAAVGQQQAGPLTLAWVRMNWARWVRSGPVRVGSRGDTGLPEELPHDRRRHRVPEAGQFTVDSPTASRRVLLRQSVISRLEEGGGARNRIDTLARVATALDHTSPRRVVPGKVPTKLTDAVQVA